MVINYNSAVIKRYLKDYKNLVYFKNGDFDIDYSTNNLSVIGKIKYSLDKKFDNLKIDLLKNNNLYKFGTTIEVKSSPLILKSIDYVKNKNQFSIIKASGNYLKNNAINLDHVSYSENENLSLFGNCDIKFALVILFLLNFTFPLKFSK